MLIENYDQGVIDVLDIYMKDCEEITSVSYTHLTLPTKA